MNAIVSTPSLLMPEGPIGGRGAWRGAALRTTPQDWCYKLSSVEIGELVSAAEATRSESILQIESSQFRLPTLGPVLSDVREELLHGKGFVLLKGVPVEELGLEMAARVYWGLGSHLGHARSQNSKGHLLGHVCNLGDSYDAFKDPSKVRIYQTRVRQRFHTDSTDFVGLLCLQKAKLGGESSICSSVAVHDEMFHRAPELWAQLYQPFWRDRRGEVPPGRKGYYPMAVFHYFSGLLSTIYARDYMESCQRFAELEPMTPIQVAALDMFDELCESEEFRLDMEFEPGDVQLLHNHQILHARADFEDWPEVERRRHLLRLWLCPPDGRPLPESMRERYLSLEVGDRGGIIGGNTDFYVPLQPV